MSIRHSSSDVASKKLHLAVHAEDAVVLQVLVVGRNRRLYTSQSGLAFLMDNCAYQNLHIF